MVKLEDGNGSFKRFIDEAPKAARAACKEAVEKTSFAVLQRMRATAEVGPESSAPHYKDALAMKVRGLVGKVGILDQASGGDGVTHAQVALFNEFTPNEQPVMRPAAKAEEPLFVRRMQEAIGQIERRLGSGTGI